MTACLWIRKPDNPLSFFRAPIGQHSSHEPGPVEYDAQPLAARGDLGVGNHRTVSCGEQSKF
jgi:hypothetical protein